MSKHSTLLVRASALAVAAVLFTACGSAEQGPGPLLDLQASKALDFGVGSNTRGWTTEAAREQRLDWVNLGLHASEARSMRVSVRCDAHPQIEVTTEGTPYEVAERPLSAAYMRIEPHETLSAIRRMPGYTATESEPLPFAKFIPGIQDCPPSVKSSQIPELQEAVSQLTASAPGQPAPATVQLNGQVIDLVPNAEGYATRGWHSTQSVPDSAVLSQKFALLTEHLRLQGFSPTYKMERVANQGGTWDYTTRHWMYTLPEGAYLSITMLRKPSPGWTSAGGRLAVSLGADARE